MSRKYLLGATKDNELVFGELEVTRRNGYPEFTACFCTVKPFNAESFDIEDYWNNYIEEMECCDNGKWVLEELKRRDCAYSDLAGELADECEDARECIDSVLSWVQHIQKISSIFQNKFFRHQKLITLFSNLKKSSHSEK